MTDLPHGPVTAEMVLLLTPGRSVLALDSGGALHVFERAKSGVRPLLYTTKVGGSAERYYDRIRFTYIGERDDDDWITAPAGGWKTNPVPGRVVEYTRRDRAHARPWGPYRSEDCRWDHRDWDTDIAAFRLADPQPATPPAPADGLKVVARAHVRSEDDGLYADLEVLNGEQMQPDHSPVPLVLKSAADARMAEQQAEIERLRGLLEEVRYVITGYWADDDYDVRGCLKKVEDTLAKIGEPR